MSTRAPISPRGMLRRVGIIGLVCGPLLMAVGIAGSALVLWTITVPGQSTSSAYARVFFVAVAVYGVIELAAGIVGWRASSRLPDVERLAGANDFLTFATFIVAFLSVVFLIVIGEPLIAIVVASLVTSVLFTTSASRKAMKAGAEGRETL